MSNIQILDANGAIQSMKTSFVSAEHVPWHILSDGTLAATVTTRGAVNILSIQVVDGSGNQITGFGGTEYTNGTIVATPAGKVALANFSGHVYALQLDAANGNLKVAVINIPDVTVSAGVVASQGTAANLKAEVVFAVPQHVIVDSSSDIEAVQDTAADLNATVVFGAPQHVIVDSGAGSGTQYVDGVTQATPTGTIALGKTSGNVLHSLALDSSGNLNVNVAAGSSGNAAASATGAAVPASADYTGFNSGGNLVGVSSANPLPVSVIAALPAGANVIGHVIVDSGAIVVTNAGTFAVQEATLDAALISQEATTSGVKGITAFGAVTTAKPTYTTAKSDALSLDVNGLLRISVADTPANTNKFLVTADAITIAAAQTLATVTTVTTVATLTTVTNAVKVTGNAGGAFDAATAASVPANAIQSGYRAATAYPTDVTDGQLVGGMADDAGRQVTILNTVRDLVGTASVQTTDQSSHTLIASGGANVFTDIISLIITNETATATVVSLSDGTVTYKFAIAASGGAVIPLPTPLPATSTATAWTVTSSATVTLDFVAVYAKNK